MAKNKGKPAHEFFKEHNVTREEAKQLHEYLLFLRFKHMLDMFDMMKIR